MDTVKLKRNAAFALQSLNQLFWPAVCVNCKQSICETDNALCKNCWDELLFCTAGDYCRRCGRDASRYALVDGACPDCQGKQIHFDQITRSGVYGDALQELILAFKKGRTELDLVLGFLASSALQGSGFVKGIEFFVPVPGGRAGPYNEPGINGYIGPDWKHASPGDLNAVINPIFRGWAGAVASYEPAPGVGANWDDPVKALGPVTGNHIDIVSLGDLSQSQIDAGVKPGQITLVFGDPCNPNDPNHIRDVNGFDFVVFENAFLSNFTNPIYGFITGEMFAELGYVEVSSDGVNFARFPSVSLTAGAVGGYGTIEISDVFNLIGKHPNAGGVCTGTPFDLSKIADDPNVVSGIVDINNISYVRIVDIPGSGDFYDEAVEYIDPDSWPNWDYYDTSHPIYDAWLTYDSGGVDLEAIGALHPQKYSGDINLDGIVDYEDLLILASAWLKQFGQDGWIARCDLAEPKDYIINMLDYAVFANQWLGKEVWRD